MNVVARRLRSLREGSTEETPLSTIPAQASHKTEGWLEAISAVESMQFMIDCLPVIRDIVARMNRPREMPLRVLAI